MEGFGSPKQAKSPEKRSKRRRPADEEEEAREDPRSPPEENDEEEVSVRGFMWARGEILYEDLAIK